MLIPFTKTACPAPLCIGLAQSPFGRCQLVWGSQGICSLAWLDSGEPANVQVHPTLPAGCIVSHRDDLQAQALVATMFVHPTDNLIMPRPWVAGTPFQQRVWSALLQIPFGSTTTYAAIAQSIGKPNAYRAVGSAIAANPVGFVIPCHRVVPQTKPPGQFRWGITRKTALLAWEASLC